MNYKCNIVLFKNIKHFYLLKFVVCMYLVSLKDHLHDIYSLFLQVSCLIVKSS